MRRTHVLLLLAATALVAARPAAPPATAAGAPRGSATTGRLRASGIVSADARLRAGAARVLLRVRGLGRWSAACTADARVSVAFVADRLLPTSDVVVALTAGAPLARRVDPGDRVAPEPPGAMLMQRWQIAPFAASQVQVAVANVAGRSVEGGCSASVLVTTGPDQGPTIT